MNPEKKTYLDIPSLSLICLSGILLQVIALVLLNLFPEDNGLFSDFMMILIIAAPFAGAAGIVIGFLQCLKLKNKTLPVLGIILNSLWVFLMLFAYVVFQSAMSLL